MLSPKDPIMFAKYRRKMRWIALAKGYGKWMAGRTIPRVTVEKRRATLIEVTNTPEARQRASERAIALGSGLWMQGRDTSHYDHTTQHARRGLTYVEIYGEERAAEEATKRRNGNRARWIGIRKADSRPLHNSDHRYTDWRTAVFERDGYRCRCCGAKGELHAHHIQSWAKFPELRYDVSNGLTLCVRHHRMVHSTRRRIRQ